MNANGNTITSFARELNFTDVGEHIYIYISLVFVWFYGISTLVGYLMPNPLYTYL